jgi:phosphodiesterase/alkaline phosphatase D-like protein
MKTRYGIVFLSALICLSAFSQRTFGASGQTFTTFSTGTITGGGAAYTRSLDVTGLAGSDYLFVYVTADFVPGTSPHDAYSSTMFMELNNGAGTVYWSAVPASYGILPAAGSTSLTWKGLMKTPYPGTGNLTVKFYDNFTDGNGPYTSTLNNVVVTIYPATVPSKTFTTFSTGTLTGGGAAYTRSLDVTGLAGSDYLFVYVTADFVAGAAPNNAFSSTMVMELNNGAGTVYWPGMPANYGALGNSNSTSLTWTGLMKVPYSGGDNLTIKFYDNFTDGNGPYTSTLSNVVVKIYSAPVPSRTFTTFSTGSITGGGAAYTRSLDVTGFAGSDYLFVYVTGDYVAGAAPHNAFSSSMTMELNNGAGTVYWPATSANYGALSNSNSTTLTWTGLMKIPYPGEGNLTLKFQDPATDASGPYTSSLSNVVVKIYSAPVPLASPTATAATNVQTGSFSANWNAVTGATGYRLDVATDSSFNTFVTGWQNVDVSNVTTYSVNSNLTPNTTYYYRVKAYNASLTTGSSNTITVTTSAAAPTVTTDAASGTGTTGTTLNGTVNANNASTTVTFEYGLTTAYGTSVTATESPVTGASNTAVSKAITGLSSNTTYHFRVVGVNSGGTTNGSDQTFTTSAAAPTVTTDAASSTTSTGTTLNGTINAKNASTTVTFEYGTTTGYGTTATAAESPVTGASNTAVSKAITGLTANTTYHFRVVGVNSGGTTNGSDLTFTTSAASSGTTLSAGDVVILEFNGAGTDGFSFMPLVNLEAGTVIHFTDYGWNASTTSFHLYEDGNPPSGGGNMITYTAPTSITAGTILRQDSANIGGSDFTADSDCAYNFGSNGNPPYNYIYSISSTVSGHDGLIVFQGTPSAPTFIWAYHTGQWGKGSFGDNYWSDLPTGLTNGTNAVFFPDLSSGTDLTVDDGIYTGLTTAASAAGWRARVADVANWTTSATDTPPAPPTGSYTVTVIPAPTITTTAVTVYNASSATMGGNVTADGGASVTERGVVYSSTDSTPTIGEAGVTKDTNGTGTGSFSESISGLSASTLYYVRAYATNSAGTGYGDVVSFTTSAAAATAPTVTTDAVSGTSSTGTTLNGTVNANSASTTVTFEYGLTTAYGTSVTAAESPVTGASNTAVSKGITGLTANTTYHCRVVGVNAGGTTNGSDQTFTTSAAAATAPTVATDAVSGTSSTGTTLNGTVNANSASTTVTFEYGLTTAYGTSVTATESPVTGSSNTAVSKAITGLTANTTYHYRVVGVNAGGTTNGSDQTFTTSISITAPTVGSPSSSVTGATTATLGGTVSAINGADVTERGVYWSTTGGFTPPGQGTKVSETGTWNSTGAFTINVTGLSAGQTVYFVAFATNSAGTGYSGESSFSTDKSDQTITFDVLADKTYGDANFDLTATASSSLTVSFVSSDLNVATVSGSTVTIVGAGTTTITASQTGNSTYNAATDVPQTLTVAKKELTVTAVDKARDFGQANPVFTMTYSDFVPGDSESDLDTAPTASCTAILTSAAGTYTVSAAGGVDDNYSFTYQTGTLTVSAIVPTVTTTAASAISSTTASSGGNVTSNGGANITARGVCYATTGNPTTSNGKVAGGTGTGGFTGNLTGLSPSTTYYVRAYATNSAGTAYGSQISFTTSAVPAAVVTDGNGGAAISNGTLSGEVGGFDPDLPVTLETDDEDGTTTLTIGSTESPTLTTILSNVGEGASISVDANETTQQKTVEITQQSGRKVTLVLVAFPTGANVGVDLGNSQILGNITNAVGQAMDVTIETTDSGGNITFTLTWHPPVSNPEAKTIWTTPNGSVSVEANGLTSNAAFTIALSYVGLNLGQTPEANLRVLKLDGTTGDFAVAGTSDKQTASATGVLGDYGINTSAKTVWVETNTLGTYAVGVPKEPVEVVTTTITNYGCMPFAGIFMGLLFMGFVGLNGKNE